MHLVQAIALATFLLLEALLLQLVILAIVDLVVDTQALLQEMALVLLVLRPPLVEVVEAGDLLVEAAVMIVIETILVRLTGVEMLWSRMVPPMVVVAEPHTAGLEARHELDIWMCSATKKKVNRVEGDTWLMSFHCLD